MKLSTKETIDNYVKHGLEPGGFVYSVLCNDLFGAIGRADSQNKRDLEEICRYVYNDIPSNCWGSSEIVEAWMKKKSEEQHGTN